MDNSEDQFQELMANAIARSNAMLRDRDMVVPFALMLSADGSIGIAIAAVDEPESAVAVLTEGLRQKAEEGNMVACCICFPQESSTLTVMLENNENYCADILLPVVGGVPRQIDLESISADDGAIRVFDFVE